MSSLSIAWDEVVPLSSSDPAPSAPSQGSFGVVLPGRHRGRRVAVKVFKASLIADGDASVATAVLFAEVEKMARASEGGLNHFVVVPVGVVSGAAPLPWLTALGPHASACVAAGSQLCGLLMRWEDGGTLHELLHSPGRAWGVGTAERLQMCAQLASGVAELHAAGVIHGDIKGDNVLLSDRSATPKPRFADFGLSELRASASSSRASVALGGKRGTWPYMAPEMLIEKDDGGPPDGVSRSGDVYALGTLCCEVLSGVAPWSGVSEQRRFNATLEAKLRGNAFPLGIPLGTPPLPVDTPALVKDLLGVCLAGARDARPRAAQVAEALHQAAQDMASGVFDIFLSHAWGEDGKHAPLTTEVYLRLLDAGYRVWLDTAEMGFDMDLSMQGGIGKSGCVVALLSSRYGTKPDPAKDNCLKELRWAKEKGKPIVACLADPAPGWFPAADGDVALLVGTHHLFPDLRPAAAVDWRAHVSATDKALLTKAPNALPKVLQLVREVLGEAEPQSPPPAPAVSAASLLSSRSSRRLVSYPTQGSEPTSTAGGGGEGGGAVGAPLLAALPPPAQPPPTGGAPRRGHCVAQLKHGDTHVYALAMVERLGLVSGGYSHIRAWGGAADTGLKGIAGKAFGLAALPGGLFAAAGAGGSTQRVDVWDGGAGHRLHKLRGHTDCVYCVAPFSRDLVASGSDDNTVRVWDAARGELVATLFGHKNWVRALAVLPCGWLASGSYDNTVRLWDVATCACVKVLQHAADVRALAALGGDRLASGGGDGRLYVWSTAGGTQDFLGAHDGALCALAALSGGLLASGGGDKTVRVWDVGARACVAVLEGHRGKVHALAAMPDGRLASGSWSDPLVRVWALTVPGGAEDAAAEAAARSGVLVKPDPSEKKGCVVI